MKFFASDAAFNQLHPQKPSDQKTKPSEQVINRSPANCIYPDFAEGIIWPARVSHAILMVMTGKIAPSLSNAKRRLLITMIALAGNPKSQNQRLVATKEKLSELTQIPVSTVFAYLKEFEELDFIERKKQIITRTRFFNGVIVFTKSFHLELFPTDSLKGIEWEVEEIESSDQKTEVIDQNHPALPSENEPFSVDNNPNTISKERQRAQFTFKKPVTKEPEQRLQEDLRWLLSKGLKVFQIWKLCGIAKRRHGQHLSILISTYKRHILDNVKSAYGYILRLIDRPDGKFKPFNAVPNELRTPVTTDLNDFDLGRFETLVDPLIKAGQGKVLTHKASGQSLTVRGKRFYWLDTSTGRVKPSLLKVTGSAKDLCLGWKQTFTSCLNDYEISEFSVEQPPCPTPDNKRSVSANSALEKAKAMLKSMKR